MDRSNKPQGPGPGLKKHVLDIRNWAFLHISIGLGHIGTPKETRQSHSNFLFNQGCPGLILQPVYTIVFSIGSTMIHHISLCIHLEVIHVVNTRVEHPHNYQIFSEMREMDGTSIYIYICMCVCPSWMNRGCKCPPAKKFQLIPKLDLQLDESGKQLASGDCSCGFARVPPFEMTTRCKRNNMLNKHMSLEGRAWRSKTPHYRPHPTSLDFLHKRYERRWWWSLTPVS